MEPKNESAKYIVGIIIIGLIIVGVSLSGNKKEDSKIDEANAKAKPTETETGPISTPQGVKTVEPSAVMPIAKTQNLQVEYTDANGFTPDKLSVKLGDTVKFVNKSSGQMWVGSDIHPTHMEYDSTSLKEHCGTTPSPSLDQCASGSEYSFTFTKTGSFNYHNHTRATMKGVVIVK